MYVLYILLGIAWQWYESASYSRLEQEKLNRRLVQSELATFRAQLNPHFLFNTLNAISTLILDKNTSVANEMVSKLSNFLRYSLDKDPMQKVDLDHEINTMKLYLEIEQVRFDDRLSVAWEIEPRCERALVPSMILQPLAENAIKHAIATQEQGGSITISVNNFAKDLMIEVADDGPGAEIIDGNLYRESGVGLVNTRERLQALYRQNFSLVVANNTPSGVKVNIRMPFEL